MSNSSAARFELPMAARLIISFVLFFGGIALLAVAFRIPEYEAFIFIAGILVSSLGLGVAIHQRRPVGH
ncbi:MAG TPA: hypothetical protein PLA13_05780 [Microbacteriaceae bacterium]|jgi:hypothetical protein|nr:hypothetical protein [Microbacteriaceae bacterium]HQX35847.1 hypothetical protein [Microbacteriaceae bacterium]HQZ48538.1 hypothetical protein [Microbacteriaceae bacterium]HRA08696.1 hypothetical protein [Microbacteriaceae bacterium]